MSFSTLRRSSQVFIFHKTANPYAEVGIVDSVSQPTPKYQTTAIPQFMPNCEMVVDLSVNVNGQLQNFQKLPANAEVADFGSFSDVVIATNRDAINAEISCYRQKSIDIINSKDTHRAIVEGCDKSLNMLNPDIAEKQRQEDEIRSLKSQMSDMAKNMEELMKMNKDLITQLNGEDAPKTKRQNGKLENFSDK